MPQSLALTAPLPLSGHPARVYLRSLSPGSRSTMQGSLNAIANLLGHDIDTLDWAALRYQQTTAIRSALLEKYAPATGNKMLCALRGAMKQAYKFGMITADDYQNAIDLPAIKGDRKLSGRALSREEISALINACGDSTKGKRDKALIGILRGAGLRRSEAVKLELRDFNNDGGIDIRQGKGGKDRLVYLPESAIAFLQDWLEVRGNFSGALLCPVRKGGRILIKHLTPQAVLYILRELSKKAGVQSFSPHDFRRTFCSDLLDSGVDIVTVQKLAGHASPITTARYDRRGEETKRKAVQSLRF